MEVPPLSRYSLNLDCVCWIASIGRNLVVTNLIGVGRIVERIIMPSPPVDSKLRHHLLCQPRRLSTVDSNIKARSSLMLGARPLVLKPDVAVGDNWPRLRDV